MTMQETRMRYLYLIYLDEQVAAARPPAEARAGVAAHAPYIEMLKRNRQYVAGDALEPSRAAHTLRTADGKPVTTQGPFAEAREQIGGYYVVEARDLDEAIELAAQCPALQTVGIAIEIRPIPAPAVELAPPGPEPRYLLAIYGDAPVGQVLAPASSATTVRLAAGKVVLGDGPFADGREQVTGFAVIGAAALAGVAPGATATIEVRPIRATL